MQYLQSRKSKTEIENLELINKKLKTEHTKAHNTVLSVKFVGGNMTDSLWVQNLGSSRASDVRIDTTSECFFELAEHDKTLALIEPQDFIKLTVHGNDLSREVISIVKVSWTNESGVRVEDQPFEVRLCS